MQQKMERDGLGALPKKEKVLPIAAPSFFA